MRDDTKSKDYIHTPGSGGSMAGGTTHYPKGGMKAKRTSQIMYTRNNVQQTKTVDGEVKSHPQPC